MRLTTLPRLTRGLNDGSERYHFAREDNIPDTLRTIAGVFPVKRLFSALVIAYDPATTGAGFAWADIGVLAAWDIGGLIVALRFFRWTPSTP